MMARAANDHQPSRQGRRQCLWLAGTALGLPLAGCTLGGTRPADVPPAAYALAMRRALVSVAGELPSYQYRATPVGNFGVGSIYLDELAGSDLKQTESSWFLGGPESWLAKTLSPPDRQRWLSRLVTEGSMGAVNVDNAGSREVHVQAGVALVAALSGQASFDARSGTDTRLQVNELRQRRLNWAEFQAALRAGLVAPDVAEVVGRGRFVIAAADLVLMGYRAELSVDESRSPGVAAALRAKMVTPSRVGAEAAWRVTEASRGRFTIAAAQPVVAAVLFKRPPAVSKDTGSAGAMANIDAWPAAPVSETAAAALESAVLQGRRDR